MVSGPKSPFMCEEGFEFELPGLAEALQWLSTILVMTKDIILFSGGWVEDLVIMEDLMGGGKLGLFSM